MSRSNYSDDVENNWGLICWRGAVNSAIRGKRGQALIRELIAGMDAMPVKELIADELEVSGQFCALGVVGRARGIDMTGIDPEDSRIVAKTFDIAEPMAREIVYINDECGWGSGETPSARWERVRKWAESQLKEVK
jgi:hypothetical protein